MVAELVPIDPAQLADNGEALPLATRYSGMVKLQGAPGTVGSSPRANTTTRAKEIVMPSHDTGWLVRRARRRIKRGDRTMSCVYFVGCSCCGLVKIGFSRNYRERLVELEKRSGHHGLIVLGTEVAPPEGEAALHRQFARDRVEGEWFRPSAGIMAHIREYTIPAGWRGY